MITGPIIAEIAALVGDPARATMLAALVDGGALTASELARSKCRAPPSTVSGCTIAAVREVAMLKGTRIPPVDEETLPEDVREALQEQRKLRGEPLYPYLFYARNPAYFRAAQSMWTALQQEAKRVPGALRALLNRRVAWWNGCEF